MEGILASLNTRIRKHDFLNLVRGFCAVDYNTFMIKDIIICFCNLFQPLNSVIVS
jgi:hypothetical protein